jgi:glutathione synthase
MDFAFIVDPLDSLQAYKDSSIAMMREAVARGHRVHAIMQGDLIWRDRRMTALAATLEVRAADHHWYEAGELAQRGLDAFDAVLMRKDPPFDMEYIYSTYLLEAAQEQGARVFNAPRAIRDHNEKLALMQYAQFTPPTLVTRRDDLLGEFVEREGDVILKPLDGMGGASIFRVRQGDPNHNVIIETLTAHGHRMIMAQRFIPEIVHGDKRVIVIAGEPVPYALARIPKLGETRGNLAAGGRGVAQALSARDQEIARAVGARLWAQGLLLVGLDIIGDHLTEINVTSPTCFVEIAQQTGFNVAGMFLDALERAVK